MAAFESIETSASKMELELIACPLCGSNVFKSAFSRADGGNVVRCLSCRFLYLNPRPHAEALLRLYNDSYYENGNGLGAYHNYVEAEELALNDGSHIGFTIISLIERFTELGGKRVLDVGCGSGSLLALAAKRGAQVCGLELAAEMARRLREKFGFDIWVGAIEEAGYDDGSFDVILLVEVIEHLTDPLRGLREISRVLKPGGLVFIATPNAGCSQTLGADWIGFKTSFEHLSFFDLRTLTLAIESVALKPRSSWSFGYQAPRLSPSPLTEWQAKTRQALKWLLAWSPTILRHARNIRRRWGIRPAEGRRQAHDLWLLAEKPTGS